MSLPFKSLLLLSILQSLKCFGRMLDSDELLVGHWNVHLQCPADRFHSQLFPPRDQITTNTNKRSSWIDSFRPSRHFPCRLQIHSNGTFHLQPSSIRYPLSVLDIRGSWKIYSNPYCVTDRFYDDIVLTSHTRVQKEIHPVQTNVNVQQQGKIYLSCRLMGHFSPGQRRLWGVPRRRRSYGKGSLTRGVVIWEDSTKNNNGKRHRSLCASFFAKRWIPSLSQLYALEE